MNRTFALVTVLWCLQAVAAPNAITEPEAWLDGALKAQGFATTFRADAVFPSVPEVPLQVEKERCYVLAVIALEASLPEHGVARWGPERSNAKQGEVFDGNYRTRLYDLGCTLTLRSLKIALSAKAWPQGKGVVKLYAQTISATEYQAGVAQAAATVAEFKKDQVLKDKAAERDAAARARMTCQDCVNAYAHCVREASHAAAEQSCGFSFDSCVDNSDVIKKKKNCVVAKH